MITVHVAKQFSRYPAGRNLKDGPYNGELFRKKYLEPNLKNHDRIEVVLDGARGYGSSFLEEAFGGLVRLGYGPSEIRSRISIVSKQDPTLNDEIWLYVDTAASRAANGRDEPKPLIPQSNH